MMANIRADFVGITIVRDKNARDIVLRAGDKVPRGVKVGTHLLDEARSAASQALTLDNTTGDPEQGDGARTEESRAGDPESKTDADGTTETGTADGDEDDGKSTGADDETVTAVQLTIPPQGGAGSGVDAWRAYALAAVAARGFNIELPEDATRADIIEALVDADIPVE